MQIINIKSGNGIESGLEGACIAIGNFDGVHKGHQEIISQVRQTADKLKKPVGIFTFEPHPISYFSPQVKNYRITPFDMKMKLLDMYGVDFVAYAEFNKEFSEITAKDFVEKLICAKLKAGQVFTGEDFIFGYKRAGNSVLLNQMSMKMEFGYQTVGEIRGDDHKRYSSSYCREMLREGNVKDARKILGRNYIIDGIVVSGRQEAAKLGSPTANVEFGDYLIPKYGVYECFTTVDGMKLKSIANIGVKPTYGNNAPLLEVHILNFNEDIYGKNISVELQRFIREEKKFNSLDELKAQIKTDIDGLLAE